jgi:putative Mn2+ efflux pump MntP
MALGISMMVQMRNCAEVTPIPLSSGLLVSFTLSVVHAALFCLGMWLGNGLSFFDSEDPGAYAGANALVFLGMSLVVVVKQILPYMGSKQRGRTFDLNAGFGRVLLFTVASGINGFLLGLGMGFVTMLGTHLHKAMWPVIIFVFLFSYLGVMYGRQHVKLRPRRWMVLSGLLILAVAVLVVVAAFRS